jgi:glycosyltransferase involved in cell wall biosynthesis
MALAGHAPLHILFVAHFAGSPRHGMVHGHYHLAREWVKAGHQVTIIAAGWAHTRDKQPNLKARVTEEIVDGIRYLWLRVPPYDPIKKVGRIVNLVSFASQALLLSPKLERLDIVICSSHCPFAFLAAERYARKSSAKLVFEVRDLWPLTLIELGGASRRNPLIIAMQWAEDRAYKNSDCVISVLPEAKDYMTSRGMNRQKFAYVPNGYATELDSVSELPNADHQNRLRQFQSEHAFMIVYAGRIGLANALDSLIRAVALLDDSSVGVVIVGAGAYLRNLKKLVADLRIGARIIFLEPVRKDQIRGILSHCEACFIGLRPSSLFRFGVSPTKLNDYLAAGKPVICAIDAPCEAAHDSGAAIVCSVNDPQAIASAIRRLRDMTEDQRLEMGRLGREWLMANRDYSILSARFLDAVLSK